MQSATYIHTLTECANRFSRAGGNELSFFLLATDAPHIELIVFPAQQDPPLRLLLCSRKAHPLSCLSFSIISTISLCAPRTLFPRRTSEYSVLPVASVRMHPRRINRLFI